MKRSSIALAWIALLLMTRVADAAVTYRYSPDLAREANPVVSVFGGGWGALVVMNALLLPMTCALTILWWRRPLAYAPSDQVHDMWSFASDYTFGQVLPRDQFLARYFLSLKRRRGQFFRELGFVVPPAVSLMSCVSIVNWYLLHDIQAPWFRSFFRATFPWYPYALPGLGLYAALCCVFFRIEWAHLRQVR